MSHKIWEINGLSLELDLNDADTSERYEKAFEAMQSSESRLPKDGKLSERIRAYCKLFRELFDTLFGAGTSEKIFADVPDNTDRYDDIYFNFLDFVSAQRNEILQQKAERFAKYKPVNRQQRRAAAKKK